MDSASLFLMHELERDRGQSSAYQADLLCPKDLQQL